MIIETLTKEKTVENMDQLLHVCRHSNLDWTEENLMMELDCKWALSFAAIMDDRVVGFSIASRREPGWAQWHEGRILKDYRGQGVVGLFIEKMVESCRELEITRITFETDVEKGPIFYKYGFHEMNPSKLDDYLPKKIGPIRDLNTIMILEMFLE